MFSHDHASKTSKKSKYGIARDFEIVKLIFFMPCRTFAMIKPDAYTNIGRIISIIEQSGLLISNLKMAKMTAQDAQGTKKCEK